MSTFRNKKQAQGKYFATSNTDTDLNAHYWYEIQMKWSVWKYESKVTPMHYAINTYGGVEICILHLGTRGKRPASRSSTFKLGGKTLVPSGYDAGWTWRLWRKRRSSSPCQESNQSHPTYRQLLYWLSYPSVISAPRNEDSRVGGGIAQHMLHGGVFRGQSSNLLLVSPAQSSRFRASPGTMTIFLFVSRPLLCFEMGPRLRRREGSGYYWSVQLHAQVQ
jgi:hypothetical protein